MKVEIEPQCKLNSQSLDVRNKIKELLQTVQFYYHYIFITNIIYFIEKIPLLFHIQEIHTHIHSKRKKK